MIVTMKTTLRRRSARLAAGLALAAGLSAGASAEQQIQVQGAAALGLETNSRVLRFGDLNLASAKDRAKLDTRLKIAAGTVCGKRSLWTVNPPADYTRCYENALSDAQMQLRQRLAAGETMIRLASR